MRWYACAVCRNVIDISIEERPLSVLAMLGILHVNFLLDSPPSPVPSSAYLASPACLAAADSSAAADGPGAPAAGVSSSSSSLHAGSSSSSATPDWKLVPRSGR